MKDFLIKKIVKTCFDALLESTGSSSIPCSGSDRISIVINYTNLPSANLPQANLEYTSFYKQSNGNWCLSSLSDLTALNTILKFDVSTESTKEFLIRLLRSRRNSIEVVEFVKSLEEVIVFRKKNSFINFNKKGSRVKLANAGLPIDTRYLEYSKNNYSYLDR